MKNLQYLTYRRWRRLDASEDLVLFELEDPDPGEDSDRQRKVLGRLDEARADGEQVELECSSDLPEVFGGAAALAEDPGMGLLDLQATRGNEVGTVVSTDVSAMTIVLRIRTRHRRVPGVGPQHRGSSLPRPGFLFAAVGGDRQRLQRRQHALHRLLRGAIPLPQLLPLLQGRLVRGPEQRREVRTWSEAARKAFGVGKVPTDAQTLALQAALNTPDIAVIQGPPGTGKTKIIAALQTRLVEEGRRAATISRQMLLTSSQHEAVDNLVERCKAWDSIPAVKIDSRHRVSMDEIDRWVSATREAVQADIDGTPAGRRARVLHEVARQAASYCAAPMTAEELVPRLDRLRGRLADLISGELLGRYDDLRRELATLRGGASWRTDPRRDSLLRTVRGVRCTALTFADDGPDRANAAVAALARRPDIGDRPLVVLRQAAEWQGSELPPFLPELAAARDELIDHFAPPVPRYGPTEPRDDVLEVLDAVLAELSASQRDSSEGITLALQEFLADLEGDPEAVYSTLRMYTPALASTCQQADSRGMMDAKDGELLFDTVIVDEAAQAIPLDLLIPLTMAQRIVLVGDHHQLPQMLEPSVEEELKVDDPAALALLRQSLFGQLFALLQTDPASPLRAVRLDTQYRMPRVLGEFVARNFYEGDLKSGRPDEDFAHGLVEFESRPAAWIRVGKEFGEEVPDRSKSRPAEARVIARLLADLAKDRADLTFGVISFYKNQVRELQTSLHQVGLLERDGDGYRPVPELRLDHRGRSVTRLQVGTVDSFQGRQFDMVLLSVTRSSSVPGFVRRDRDRAGRAQHRYVKWAEQAYGHLALRNRLCVAMSRQKRLLAVVGDDELFADDVAPQAVGPLTDFRRMCDPAGPGVLLEPAPGGGVRQAPDGRGG